MSEENTLGNTSTETPATGAEETNQETVKTYTQAEFDNHMAGLKKSLQNKFERQYAELGDIEELKALKAKEEKRAKEESVKRGEFEKVLTDLATKKDAEIKKRDEIIRNYKVNVPLLEAAAKHNSVNAEQVKQLLSNQLRLNDVGDVEVIDNKGQVRYDDSGKPIGVDTLVDEFLKANPHFKAANPATTNTQSNVVTKGNKELDVTKLDMNKAEDRALYKKYKQAQGLR